MNYNSLNNALNIIVNTDLPKFKICFPVKEDGILKHFLPFTLLVTNRHDRDLAISLLGFRTRQAYVEAVRKNRDYATMLSILLTLFALDNPKDKETFFGYITFKDKELESRMAHLCNLEENGLSVEELESMWNVSSLPEE